MPELARETRPDLVLVNDDDLTYAKIRLDPQLAWPRCWPASASSTDSLPRALCWAAAWDMAATPSWPPATTSGWCWRASVGSVIDVSVAQTLLRQAEAAIRRYADPAWRRDRLSLVADALQELLARAEPGSDVQLAYAEAFAARRSPARSWRYWPACSTARTPWTA